MTEEKKGFFYYFYLPEKEMSGEMAMTRVSPPTYLRTPSEGLGRIFPPKLHMNFTLLLGDFSPIDIFVAKKFQDVFRVCKKLN